jgi:2'-5' RNA ligase
MTDATTGASSGQESGRASESALLLLVPAAEPAVAKHRAALDASARHGVPAHLTVLYPFLPPGLIDDAVLASLGDLFAGVAAFRFTLDRVGWFGDDVVWLGPHDEAPVRALTELAFAAFPSCAPYGGQYADVVPHLTVGHLGGASALRAAGEAVGHRLPIDAAATKVTLMTGPPPGSPGRPPGRWRTVAEFALGRAGRFPEPPG